MNLELQRGRVLSSAETRIELAIDDNGMMLQRGRVLSSAETRLSVPSVANNPRLQRGRVLSSAETGLPCNGSERLHFCFNGAAFFRARKLNAPDARDAAALDASTGPRSFERGNKWHGWGYRPLGWRLQRGRVLSSAETFIDSAKNQFLDTRFNGAAFFRARKRLLRNGIPARIEGASTGPRSFERGNTNT